ncbi:hypothetical protein [Streptomyces chromofuscus]|uniref:Uncharacterized protein n=1 Tax=Streptomyces chromofuscus TaxID=42881 RepID=A0A7M2T664_STRCW|nr:hypothetical protein [Streptomyces chromofuscus]QOV43383.1 hypothetical protein IPT68_27140 [Streptomyces chromofuscus]GGT41740.1 hypothetical protein GCM10010254_71750 [Streptomyces chromofuscus]
MSGDKNQPNVHQAEHQEAAQQNGSLDAVMHMTKVINPWGPDRGFHFGRTSFENYDLNQMIDIVESASPELLEEAGNALVNARDAIRSAAEELGLNLQNVDWQGEAHKAFHTWGNDLVSTAEALADYAETVGTQVMAASSGLASVRKSMPPRDTRSTPKTVDDIPEAKQVDSNDEYTAALKAEKHRQEAINQMYRLASFYTVSNGMMQKAEEPVFPKMPDVGVPKPPPGFDPRVEHPGRGTLETTSDTRSTHHPPVNSGTRAPVEDLSTSHKSVDESLLPSKEHVGTKIDSLGTAPPQEAVKPTPVTSTSTTGPAVASGGSPHPIAPVSTSPVSRHPARSASGSGAVPLNKTPASAQGRVGGTPTGSPAGRTGIGPTGSVGRAVGSGQATGRTTGPGGQSVVGGVPKPAAPAAGQAGGVMRGPVTGMGATNARGTATGRAGVGRTTDGIVGGRPVSGTTSGAAGSRGPRGTVIGGQSAITSRSTAERPGQRGVIGVPGPTTSTRQAPRRPAGSPDGVVGTPTGRAHGVKSGGVTPGTTGATPGREGGERSGETRTRRDE